MKILSAALFITFLFTAGNSIAQNAHEGKVKFMKADQNAIIADYDLPKDVVENALRERFDKMNLGKVHSKKGYSFYEGVNWTDISPDKIDLYFDVSGKGSKSTVTMLVSKGYDNFITSASDAEKVQKVEAFLNAFIKDAQGYQLRAAIAAQEEVVKRAERGTNNAYSDGKSLQNDLERIQRKIAENKAEQEKATSILEAERKKLEEMKRQLAG